MEKVIVIAGVMLFGAVIIAGLSLLFAIPVYFLWNALMPELFRLPVITFWQALGLTILCGLLFKSNHSSSSKS